MTAVKAGRFREDLFYRLNVIHIRVPPLRERKQDLSKLIQYFLKHYAAKHARKVERVSPPALEMLQAYEYPGNARELANIVERAVIVATGKAIEQDDLPVGLSAAVQAQQRKAAAAKFSAARGSLYFRGARSDERQQDRVRTNSRN